MRFFIGVTDNDWFNYLSNLQPDEINFWRPGGTTFRALEPGGLFLFKLHSPLNFIAGGGYFLRYTKLPLSIAWSAFGQKNGLPSEESFLRVINSYRKDTQHADPEIGCIVLAEPFFWPRNLWIPVPEDWPKSAVQGKGFDSQEPVGRQILSEVEIRLAMAIKGPQGYLLAAGESRPSYGHRSQLDEGPLYSERLTKIRLGQGGFRVLVTDAYERRCAITGEKTLPVLEAAHIKPFSKTGPHAIDNGVLLRSDMHILFDRGYLTITPDLKIEVSKRIHDQFTNGKLYYSYHGMSLRSIPVDSRHHPSTTFLDWHNRNVFVA
jgi:putative restriction endonuclease